MSRCSICGKHKLSTEPDPCAERYRPSLGVRRRFDSVPLAERVDYSSQISWETAPSAPIPTVAERRVTQSGLTYQVVFNPITISHNAFAEGSGMEHDAVTYRSREDSTVPLTDDMLMWLPALVDDFSQTE